jgi:hypothetical protein
MKKKISLFFSIFFFVSSLCFAQWVPLDKNSTPDSKPNVQLISDDINGTIIKVELPGFRIREFKNNGITYHSIQLDEKAITNAVGLPEIPHIAKILAIPDHGTVSFEVLETSEPQIIKGIIIPPAREGWIEGKPETPYLENKEAYSSSDIYPQEIVSVEDPAVFRDFRIARVSIFPIRYSPAKQEIEIVSTITIKVKYGDGDGINPKLTSKKPIAPSFAKVYKSTIFNFKEVLEQRYAGRVDGHDIMLCITPDIYIEEFQPYADWKNKSGTEIFITKFSDIGATQSDPQPIKDHILNVYNTWSNPPTHILLVGDYGTVTNCVPRKRITLDGWTFASEDWFVELAGNDYFPEMMIGRWTHHANGGEERLQIMVDKFLKYEKYPSVTGNDWYKKGIVCSNNAYASQIQTKRETAEKMMLYGNFISVDTMMSVYPSGCPYNLTDVKNAINNGRSFLNYRGEGWSYGWWANCYQFETSDVSTLINYNKLTFVTSIGCGVAMFDNNVQCFGEEWIEMGSLGEDPKGGCAFIGPTSNTHTAWNNNIDRGIYTGMFEEGMDSPGEALLRGKLYMYEVFGGSDPYVEYHYKIYCILGDPSLHIWKDLPRVVSVNYPDSISIGNNQIQITVTDSISGLPVNNARICISGNDVYVIETTGTNGIVTLDINSPTIGQLYITVCGGTVKPFEGTIQVVDEVQTTFQLSVSVNNGWNMVSIPGLHPTDQNVDTWWQYRDMGANVFKYSGAGYVGISSATPSEGYWMKHASPRMYNTGEEWPAGGIQIVPHTPINAIAGWNLIGGYESITPTSGLTTTPPGLISGPLYEYSSGYQEADNLVPGYGYWIKLTGAGQINLPTGQAGIPGSLTKGVVTKEYVKEGWGKIILTDAIGINYTLYAVKGEVNLDNYELPPAPPAGMFDIRFGSGRIAEDINSSIQTIDMSGVTYPLTVRAEGMDIRLMDETGSTVNVNLRSGKDVVISDATIQKLLVTGELIPAAYALEQNYPNPFNPSTTIEFSLPEDVSNVKLSIYNALGEKIAELINSSLTAGKYQYQWNAKNVATGMYIYELRTEKFISMKKMILLK